jgi:hypothetical protein
MTKISRREFEWLLAEFGQTFLDSLDLGLQGSQVLFQACALLGLRLKPPPEPKTLAVSAAAVAATLVPAATVTCALALFLAPAATVSVLVMRSLTVHCCHLASLLSSPCAAGAAGY